MWDLRATFESGDFEALIRYLRKGLGEDRRLFTDPFVKQWLGLRWRDLFLKAAMQDEAAVAETYRLPGPLRSLPITSRRDEDTRTALAKRFLKDSQDLTLDLPEAQYDQIEHTAMVLVPGMLTGLLHPGAHAFACADELQAERGWRYYRCDAHALRGCDANGDDIVRTLDEGRVFDLSSQEAITVYPPEKVFLVGYSKGAADILHFLVNHPQYAGRVQAVYTWAGAVGGSYTADSMHEQINGLDLSGTLSAISPSAVSADGLRRLDEYDAVGAFHDLGTQFRTQYLAAHGDHFDSLGIPFLSVTGATTALEVPNFAFADTMRTSELDPDNDMQLTQQQATLDIEMATRVAMLNAHHWDIAYEAFPAHMRAASPNLEHPFPKKAALIASWELLAELGVID